MLNDLCIVIDHKLKHNSRHPFGITRKLNSTIFMLKLTVPIWSQILMIQFLLIQTCFEGSVQTKTKLPAPTVRMAACPGH